MLTELGKDISMADIKAQYDGHAKNLFKYKPILARILKNVTEEFAPYDVETIESFIEQNVKVSQVEVDPGGKKIFGKDTESNIPDEGKVYFDILFDAYKPDIPDDKVIVDVEAQKKYDPGYDLVPRGIFYCARILSQEYNVEFNAKDYSRIKKVYSIWICKDVPDKYANTITSYSIKENDMYGEFTGETYYDLVNVVMIRLGSEDIASDNELIGLLKALLSDKMGGDEKIEILENDYGLKMNKEVEEELRIMCNLSDLVEERGIAIGEERGIARGTVNVAKKMLKANKPIVEIMEFTELSEEEIRKLKEEI